MKFFTDEQTAYKRWDTTTSKEDFSLFNYNCSTFVSDILKAGRVSVHSNNPNMLWLKLQWWNSFR